MKYINELKTSALQSVIALQDIAENGYKTYNTYKFKIRELRDFSNENILYSEYKEIFDSLQNIKGPVLYWFEIKDDYDRNVILEKLSVYKAKVNLRSTPAIKRSADMSSNVLYVGKVKQSFYGRVIQHLGFFTNPQTQGLQLYHWLKGEDITLELHACEFKNDMAGIIGILENDFARLLKPIIGKHK